MLAISHPFTSAQLTASALEEKHSFAAQWLAYALPCRRFAGILTDASARLGVDVGRYSFVVVDFHLLLARSPGTYQL